MPSFKAVVFDIDGTLYPNLVMKLASIPHILRHARLYYYFNRVRRQIRGIRPIIDFRALQSELLAASMGIPILRAIRLIEDIIYSRWEDVFRVVRPYCGVRTLRRKLRARGLILGLLSDFPLRRKLELLRLDQGWDFVLISETIGYLKPNPESFLEILARTGLRPEEILYVGNSYAYDVEGALACGLRAAHLKSRVKPGLDERGVFRFSRFSDLEAYILGCVEAR